MTENDGGTGGSGKRDEPVSMYPSLKVESWNVAEVIDWLENKDLHKFVTLFQKHNVTGTDLVNLKLPFLDDYEHISVEDREVLLAEIYNLLNPSKVFASEEDLTKIKSPEDKIKYIAAVELAQSNSANLQRSTSVFTFPSQHATLPSSSSSQPSPGMKPRHKSESGVEHSSGRTRFHPRFSDTKKRKTLPKILSSPVKPMYEFIKKYGSDCVHCVELSPQQRDSVTMAIDNEGHVTIQDVPTSLQDALHKGDRVIEINGHLVRPHLKVDAKSHITSMLNYRSPSTIVILTKHIPKPNIPDAEQKWQKLQSMLIEMRDSDSVFTLPAESKEFDHDKYFKDTSVLQEQIKKLEEKVKEQQSLSEDLRIELEDKDAIMHDLELSRDKAIEKLRETRRNVRNKNSRESVGGGEYYNMTINALNLEESTKEQVVESLKEIITEASKQKWYLDRLISLVIEESPWLLDEVDSEFDTLALTDESEEFC